MGQPRTVLATSVRELKVRGGDPGFTLVVFDLKLKTVVNFKYKKEHTVIWSF